MDFAEDETAPHLLALNMCVFLWLTGCCYFQEDYPYFLFSFIPLGVRSLYDIP